MPAADLAGRVRTRLAGDGFGAGASGAIAAAALDRALREETDGVVDDVVFAELRRSVTEELTGAGPLEPLLALPRVTDVLVNGPDSVWVDRGAGVQRVDVRFPDDAAVRRLAQRLAAAAGRRLDDAVPFADAVLPDGTRLHAVLPPLCPTTVLSLRVLARQRFDLASLVQRGMMCAGVAQLLEAVVAARMAVVVTGGTGTGKTTLLATLLATVSPGERLVVIEDAPELVIDHPHVVRLLARAANVEGAGAVGLRELVRQSLRMRPDRLVVGEFRGAELAELAIALNTGHDGGAATMHANSAADVPARFIALGALAGLSETATCALVDAAFDVVVHLRRGPDGQRRLDEVALLEAAQGQLVVQPVWSVEQGTSLGAQRLVRRLRERRVAVPALFGEHP